MELTLGYRHEPTLQPRFLTHGNVQAVAAEVRNQLGVTDKLTLGHLTAVDRVVVNGVAFRFEISLDHPVHDADQQPVLGICDFDAAELPEVASLLVNGPLLEGREDVLLSTLAHEMGHGLFDAPAWIARAAQASLPGLAGDGARLVAYRSVTHDTDHLSHPSPRHDAERFAEFRANEFMGALLVPAHLLRLRLCDFANEWHVPMIPIASKPDRFGRRGPKIDVIAPGISRAHLNLLCGALSSDFGVTARFIEVRLMRYGLLSDPRDIAA